MFQRFQKQIMSSATQPKLVFNYVDPEPTATRSLSATRHNLDCLALRVQSTLGTFKPIRPSSNTSCFTHTSHSARDIVIEMRKQRCGLSVSAGALEPSVNRYEYILRELLVCGAHGSSKTRM